MNYIPTQGDVEELKQHKSDYCVTLYVPAVSGPLATSDGRNVVKNMLRQAEDQLMGAGADKKNVSDITAPVRDLLMNNTLWPPARHSLAIFLAPGLFRQFQVPHFVFEPLVYVGSAFDTKPLKHAVRANAPYYVLVLSGKQTKLYQGDLSQFSNVSLGNLPQDVLHGLNIDEFQKSRQMYSINMASKNHGGIGYHEQADPASENKTMLRDYFRLVDAAFKKVAKGSAAPLFLGGVEHLQAIYRGINTYARLQTRAISGNLDHATKASIHNKALAVIAPVRTAVA